MLREAVASGSDLGVKVSNILDSGGLVSDDIIGSLIKERLTKPDCAKGSLFDGKSLRAPCKATKQIRDVT